MRGAEHKTFSTPSRSNKKHVWAKVQGDVVVVGVTDCLQRLLGTVINVEFSENSFVEKGCPIAWLESIKAVIALPSPMDCEVVKVNARLVREPWLVNTSPYKEGWIASLRALNMDGLKKLQTVAPYIDFI